MTVPKAAATQSQEEISGLRAFRTIYSLSGELKEDRLEHAHLIMLSLCAFAPVLIARYLVRGTWLQVVHAHGLWMAILFVLGFLIGGPHGAGYGWAILIAMFTTVFAVPALTGILRWRQRRAWRAGRQS